LAGPSWQTDFRAAGHIFDVEVYLGRAASKRLRSQADAILNSLKIA
jgi:hypothetical protein